MKEISFVLVKNIINSYFFGLIKKYATVVRLSNNDILSFNNIDEINISLKEDSYLYDTQAYYEDIYYIRKESYLKGVFLEKCNNIIVVKAYVSIITKKSYRNYTYSDHISSCIIDYPPHLGNLLQISLNGQSC